MQLLCDEDVDRQIVERLRDEGYDVGYVAEMDPGVADEVILEQARRRHALLVTADKDFGDLVFRTERATAGVLLLRLAGLSSERKGRLVASVFERHEGELAGAFSVLVPGGVRIRTHPS